MILIHVKMMDNIKLMIKNNFAYANVCFERDLDDSI